MRLMFPGMQQPLVPNTWFPEIRIPKPDLVEPAMMLWAMSFLVANAKALEVKLFLERIAARQIPFCSKDSIVPFAEGAPVIRFGGGVIIVDPFQQAPLWRDRFQGPRDIAIGLAGIIHRVQTQIVKRNMR